MANLAWVWLFGTVNIEEIQLTDLISSVLDKFIPLILTGKRIKYMIFCVYYGNTLD